jgi:putative ABC transport system permease protein
MGRFRSRLIRLGGLFRKRRREREMAEELESHLQMHIEDNLRSGMTPEEARRQALIKLGGLEQVKEDCRDARDVRFIKELFQDIRYGLRQLRRNPGFTVVAVLTLALGIGANTAIFSVVDAALLRPLPYRDPDRLVMVWNQLHRLGLNQFPASYADYSDYKTGNRVFDDIAAFEPAHFDLAGNQPERVLGMRTSANLFPLLGVKAELGRTFLSEENQPGRNGVVVLSDALWRRRFGADPAVLGKSITLDGGLYMVIGILPRTFRFSIGGPVYPDVWLPIALHPDPQRQTSGLQLIARLRKGVSVAEATVNMKAIALRLAQQFHLYRGPHGEDAGYDVTVVPLRDQVFGALRGGLLIMLGAVGFVLLIACANVSNLLLARGTARRKEIAVRASLGASRGRISRQLLTESLLLGVGGAGAGMGLARWGIQALTALSPNDASRLLDVHINGAVLTFVGALVLLTTVIFGVVPAAQSSGAGLNLPLAETRRSATASVSRHRFSSALVVGEVALSLVLLAGAGLLLASLLALVRINPGFNPENVVTARVSLPQSEYRQAHQVADFYNQLVVRLQQAPEVASAGLTSMLPLADGIYRNPFSIEGRQWQSQGADGVPQVANFEAVTPGYFQTLQIPLLRGRLFSALDGPEQAPVAIVSRTLVRGFWPDRDPLGRHIMMGAPRPGVPWLTIVGVVGDVHASGLDSPPIPQIYVPQNQHPSHTMAMVLRTPAGARKTVPFILNTVHQLDPARPVYDISTMDAALSSSVASRRYDALLLGLFAALALLLAAIGLFGTVSYSVTQRTNEIGIRMALGAERNDVLKMVIGQGLRLALIGVTIGIAGALALTRFLSSLLYGVKPTDPLTFVAVSLILIAVALIACYIPARRAAKVDPMVALRYE